MQFYDFICAIRPDIQPDEETSIIDHLKGEIEKREGVIHKCDEWGLKKLAYPIKKFQEAKYYLIQFYSLPKDIKQLNSLIKVDENILRYIFVKLDKELGKKKEKKTKKESR